MESAGVVGIPDSGTGERVKAFVTLHDDADAEGIEERLLALVTAASPATKCRRASR